MHSDRIRRESLLDKVVSAEEAARFIKNGMTIGMSGFTRAGEAKKDTGSKQRAQQAVTP